MSHTTIGDSQRALRPVQLLCIANSKSKRWKSFANSLQEFSVESPGRFDADLVEWIDLIESDGDLASIESLDLNKFEIAPAIVRVESPSKDFEIIRGLLAAGAKESGASDDLKWSDVEYEKGKIVEPRLVYLGLKRILHRLKMSAGGIKGLTMLADPIHIAEMFDKNATSNRLLRAGISTPEIFEFAVWPDGQWDREGINQPVRELFDELRSVGVSKFYAKLACDSACCGMLICPELREHRIRLISTMVRIDGAFYNTRKLQSVRLDEVGHWIDFLVKQGVAIQKGINKACIDGDNFDLRAVVIDGQVEFTIFRVSQHPVTGLHFGGHRGDWKRCREAIPDRAWLDAMEACVEAASLYGSHVVGVDLAFDRSYMNHFIIELNPWGDFFPGWTNDEGKSIHQMQLESYLAMTEN